MRSLVCWPSAAVLAWVLGMSLTAPPPAGAGETEEEEVYMLCGEELSLPPDGAWLYASERSAAVAWETSLPAVGFVEYGETEKYGQKSPEDSARFFIHVHYLRDLKPGATYHYRTVSRDVRSKTVTSKDATFATSEMKDAVRVPGELKGPPYVLDKPNATYLLTGDLRAERTALEIADGADGVTLDLGGHTLTFNEKADKLTDPTVAGQCKAFIANAAYGIRVNARSKVKLVNGRVCQGKGNDNGCDYTIGYNPVFFNGIKGLEVAGLTLEYQGPQISGLYCLWGGADADVHHNVVEDKGWQVLNRDLKCAGIHLGGKDDAGGGKLHHNLVRNSRQAGVGSLYDKSEIFANELHIDSYAVNSYCIEAGTNSRVYRNKVFGTGFNANGIADIHGGAEIYQNYVRLQGIDLAPRLERCNTTDGVQVDGKYISVMSCCRIKWGARSNEVDYHDNFFVVKGTGGGVLRGTFLYNEVKKPLDKLVFRNNYMKMEAQDAATTGFGAVACNGDHDPASPPQVFRDCTIVSNACNVSFGDSYGTGTNQQFVNCTFRRSGSHPAYRTIQASFNYASVGNVFLDCAMEGGASFDAVVNRGYGGNFEVRWTLGLATLPGAEVRVKDAAGKEVFAGQADGQGKLSIPLAQYRYEVGLGQAAGKKTALTPHAVAVSKDGKTAERSVTMDRKQALEVKF